MAKELKLRRGTTTEHSTFTGAEGEVTVDTTKDTVVVHDGATAGGVPLAKEADIPTGALASLDSVDASTIDDNSVGAAELNVPGNGTSGQYLASDGDGTMTWTTLPAGGGFSNLQVFNNPGTWTNPGNVEKVKVTLQAGGGAGSGAGSANSGGAGGGAAIEVISFPTGTNVPVTVGNGGTVNYSTGNPGGSSSFGAYCSANGGGGAPNSSNAYVVGGNGVGGNINFPGQGGSYNPSPGTGGQGGDSYLGSGGQNLTSAIGTQHPVMDGRLYGGGGASTNNPGARGGAGAKGIVIVEY